jgi:hypothetical protein
MHNERGHGHASAVVDISAAIAVMLSNAPHPNDGACPAPSTSQ